MKWISCCLMCVAIVFLNQPVQAGDKAAAKEAFDEGTKLFSQKQYDEAAERFREAYALKATWKLLYNIGQAEAAAKRYGLALEAFERYLAEGGDEVENSRRSEVLEEIRKMRDMVGDLLVKGPADAVVSVDGVEWSGAFCRWRPQLLSPPAQNIW
ncbi:MAG: tetratricopeptide repeat protein [Deltaproteobacteria bacterium]|nr:tetratricopeptide repeat protein [Deltaproteobacteria bacterium]